jgi:hypothetical protein
MAMQIHNFAHLIKVFPFKIHIICIKFTIVHDTIHSRFAFVLKSSFFGKMHLNTWNDS